MVTRVQRITDAVDAWCRQHDAHGGIVARRDGRVVAASTAFESTNPALGTLIAVIAGATEPSAALARRSPVEQVVLLAEDGPLVVTRLDANLVLLVVYDRHAAPDHAFREAKRLADVLGPIATGSPVGLVTSRRGARAEAEFRGEG